MKGFLSSYYVHFKICVNSQGEFSLPFPTDGIPFIPREKSPRNHSTFQATISWSPHNKLILI